MSDQNDVQNEAEPEAENKTPGRKRKKMTAREQLREIGKLIVLLAIAGGAYGGYVAYTYLRVDGFTLTDQFHQSTTVEFTGDKPHVVLVGNLETLQDAMGWGMKLLGSYGDKIENVRIADLSASDPGIHGVIQGQIAKRVPVPVLLDYEGGVSKAFHASSEAVTICVVGSGGAVKARASGEMTDESWAKIAAALDAAVQ